MKEALRYFKKVSRPLHLSKRYNLKLKNAKNIETMNLLNTRPMKVALRYIKKNIWTVTFIEAIYFEN